MRPGSANLLKKPSSRQSESDLKPRIEIDYADQEPKIRRKLSRSCNGSISGLDTFLRAKSCVNFRN